jgi:predicted Zn-dependent peptidase
MSEYYKETGYVGVYAGVDIKRIDESIKVILDQMYGLATKKYKITEPEFKKAKEFIKGHLALSLEDTKAINGFFGLQELLLGKIETPKDVIDRIDNVSTDAVYDYAKSIFKPERLNLAIIGPYKSSSQFEKLLK